VAQTIGKRLSEEVVIQGKAQRLKKSWRIVAFTIDSIAKPQQGSILDAFEELRRRAATLGTESAIHPLTWRRSPAEGECRTGHRGVDLGRAAEGQSGRGIKRQVLKADVQIVATAKVAGAGTFYSHDLKCRKLAVSAGLTARDLPTHSQILFIDAEMKKGLPGPSGET